MLSNNKIHPRLAFEHCGLFVDPELAYTESKEYTEEREAELLKELETDSAHKDDGSEDESDESEDNDDNAKSD